MRAITVVISVNEAVHLGNNANAVVVTVEHIHNHGQNRISITNKNAIPSTNGDVVDRNLTFLVIMRMPPLA